MKNNKLVPIITLLLILSSCTTHYSPEEFQLPVLNKIIPMDGITMTKEVIDSREQQEFFKEMGIRVDDRKKHQFIVGDNLAGYFEGYTNTYNLGAGYNMGKQSIYKNFASYIDGEFLNRKRTTDVQIIQPYGTEIIHNNSVREEFVLHAKNHSLSMRVQSETPGITGIVPILNGDFKSWNITNSSNEIYFEGRNTVIVFTANQPFELTMNDGRHMENETTLKLDEYSFRGVFSTLNKTDDFILYAGFASTLDGAEEKAKQLRETEAHNLEKSKIYNMLTKSSIKTDDLEFNKAVNWAKYSGYTMVVEEFGKGIWAGLPWFKDNWGRDTFIALPGTLLVSGQFNEAKEVLNNFANFQNRGGAEISVTLKEKSLAADINRILRTLNLKLKKDENKFKITLSPEYVENPILVNDLLTQLNKLEGVNAVVNYFKDRNYGRIPNRVTSLDNMIYNTTDGTPWLIREIYEYIQYSGDVVYAKEIFPMVETAVDGVLLNFIDDKAFMTHEDADTWMDAKINGNQPWSARGSRAVEIQALWYSMLEVSAYLAQLNNRADLSEKWLSIAQQMKVNFETAFWNKEENFIADRLRDDNTPDFRVRPNQLMVITIPMISELLSEEKQAWIVKNSVDGLLYPYGISSLNEEDPYFHPYHENGGYYHKDAAYHNGTIWGWNAGLIVEGLIKFGQQDFSYELTKNLSNQILTMGTLGSMSENLSPYLDKRGDIILSGTYSQAWSVSEFTRNAYQDYLGFNPELISNKLVFTPSFPSSWNTLEATLPFGKEDVINISSNKTDDTWTINFKIKTKRDITIEWDNKPVVIKNGAGSLIWKVEPYNKYQDILDNLTFRTPVKGRTFPMTEHRHVLKDIILNGEYR